MNTRDKKYYTNTDKRSIRLLFSFSCRTIHESDHWWEKTRKKDDGTDRMFYRDYSFFTTLKHGLVSNSSCRNIAANN